MGSGHPTSREKRMGRLAVVASLCALPILIEAGFLYQTPLLQSQLSYINPGYVPLQPLSVPTTYSATINPDIMGNRKHEIYSSHTYMGNRDFASSPVSSYQAGCEDLTSAWHVGETGSSGTIKVKRERSGWDYIWEMEMVYDKPVSFMEVTNGVVDQVSGQRFKITPTTTFARSGLSSDDVKVGFKATYASSDNRPILDTIIINGKYHKCNAASQQPKPKPMRPSLRNRNHPAWPKKIVGLYILLADDDEDGYESNAEWQQDPELFAWQQEAANVLFFTFIHPDTMDIPPSFQKLAATRGTGAPGSVPSNTVIMFAIGGYAYSKDPNPWHWLTSKEAAEKMAEKVAEWPDRYGCDGIDLDLEEGAGSNKIAGPNMVHFVKKLKELAPNIIVSQPTYGYPQVQAEIDVINASWDDKGNKKGVADSIGLMVYEGTQTLQYVKNYAKGADQWGGYGFPITCRAPTNTILLGAKGATSAGAIATLAEAAIKNDYLGIMVWYASIKNGFDYAPGWDASTSNDAIKGYVAAMKRFRQVTGDPTPSKPVEVVVAPEDPKPIQTPAPPQKSTPKPVQTPAPVPKPTPSKPVIAPVVAESGHAAWPKKIMGLYVLLADDTEDGFGTTADWEPKLFPWQQESSNVLFFTFIHPESMEVPEAYKKLAATRGTGAPGSVPANTVIMFAIGGYAYSIKPNPWHWLTSKAAAEEMAEKVAKWPDMYGCDGIDLDLEEGAGSNKIAGPNMVHFVKKLKELNPSIIVSQPTYGWPQVQAEIDVINASWDSNGNSKGVADSIGLMVYQGTTALNYVKNYDSSKRWQGHPISAAVPNNAILLGAKGVTSSNDITTMANKCIQDDLLGIMVWYASVDNGFQYKHSEQWDASISEDSIAGYKSTMNLFRQGGAVPRIYY